VSVPYVTREKFAASVMPLQFIGAAYAERDHIAPQL